MPSSGIREIVEISSDDDISQTQPSQRTTNGAHKSSGFKQNKLDDAQPKVRNSQNSQPRGPAFRLLSTPKLRNQAHQPGHASRGRESTGDGPKNSIDSKESSQKKVVEVIPLDGDDDGETQAPVFKMPRGYDLHGKKTSSSTESPSLHSNEDSTSSRKRPREPESSLGTQNPSKRAKQSHETAVGSPAKPRQTSELHINDAVKSPSSLVTSQRKERRRIEISKAEAATPHRSELGLNLQNPVSPQEAASRRSTKSSKPNRSNNGDLSASALTGKRSQIIDLDNSCDELSEDRSNRQDFSNRSSQKRSQSAARSESLALRGRRKKDLNSSSTLDPGKSPAKRGRAIESDQNIASTRGTDIENGHLPAIKASNDSTGSTGSRTPNRRNRKNDARIPSPANNEKFAKPPTEAPQERSQNHGKKNDSGVTTAKAPRRTASDEDQGYASLSSSNGDEQQNGEKDSRADSGAVLGSQTRSARTPEPHVEHAVGKEMSRSGRRTGVGTRLQSAAGASKALLIDQESPEVPKSPLRKSRSPSPDRHNFKASSQSKSQKQYPIMSSLAAKYAAQMSHDSNEREWDDEDPTKAGEADAQLRSEAGIDDDGAIQDEDGDSTFALPTTAASTLKSTPVYSNLPLATQVEKVLGKYLEELRGDHEYWTSVSLGRARLSKEDERGAASTDDPEPEIEEPTSFANLRPLKISPVPKGVSAKSDSIWGIQKMAAHGSSSKSVSVSAPYMGFHIDAPDVPNYTHYVSIKNNVLAPNVTNLHCWPYFGDDFDMDGANNLHEQYNLDIENRPRKLLRLLQGCKYETYVESALDDLGCLWSDLLRFLLEPNPDVGTDLGARKALQGRDGYCHKDEDFDRQAARWVAVLNNLPASSSEKMARVAVLSENFQKMAKFSIWHVARRCELAKLPETSKEPTKAQPTDNELTCRICLRFNCPYHGEFKESADEDDSDADSVPSAATVVATDILHPQRVNYRSRVAFAPALPIASERIEDAATRKLKTDLKYWSSVSYQHKADERGPFYPCHHPGTSCEDAECSCYHNKVPCEKICSCAPDCRRKFQGCSCSIERPKKGQRSVCWEDERCVCYQIGRECDPDLCGECGVCDVVDRVNKYNDKILHGRCHNAGIQRAVPKHTILGDSGVHGLGLYACEHIKVNDFVGEYKGEIITKEEADRRGAVYEHQKLSYLFSLNATQEIDSTYVGNKVRFINHAHGNRANLYPRIIMVNSVHRIALYAQKEIHSGEELLFDYGPKFPDEQLGGKKNKKSAPHVRNANLVRDFLDVEEDVDEFGNRRAKGVSQSSKRDDTDRRARRGARAGAGRRPHEREQRQQDQLEDTHDESEGHDYDEPESESESEAEHRAEAKQNAGERLAAFNISDDGPAEAMEVDSNYDDVFHPDGSEEDDSEASEPASDLSESEDEEGDDVLAHPGRRGGVTTRRLAHR